MKKLVLIVVMALGALMGGAAAQAADVDYQAIARRVVDEHIRPAYAALDQQAGALRGKLDDLCQQPSPAALTDAQDAFRKMVLAWSHVEHIRFGPVAEKHRYERRPGRFAVAVRPDGRRKPVWFQTRSDRHFYGHGVFSADGRLLLSSENDYDGARGVIGVRDAGDGYRQIGEFASHGIGPHDMAFLSDRRTLVVANGAMQTHPSSGRAVLNLATMRPSLAYIDSLTGDLLEEHVLAPELHRLSIRHLGVAAGDTVVIGCQYRGPLSERPALIGFHRRGRQVEMARAPDETQLAMDNYIGSVAMDRSRQAAALSSPRGSIVTYWDVGSRRYLGGTRLADVCGLAPGRATRAFLLTSGSGRVETLQAGDVASLIRANPALEAYLWDNHAAAL